MLAATPALLFTAFAVLPAATEDPVEETADAGVRSDVRPAEEATLAPQPVPAVPDVEAPPQVEGPSPAARIGKRGAGVIYPLVFPVAGDCLLTASFGDPRPGGRRHKGEDMMAAKLTPVVAAASGVVLWTHDEIGGRCCDVALRHDDGWRSRYIHLNNDTPGTDDGRGYGIVADLRPGTRVEAGELIGWVGDSGNAEATGPHLHFELRRPDGRAVDPYVSLVAAAAAAEAAGHAISGR